jgi:hypothetical protein
LNFEATRRWGVAAVGANVARDLEVLAAKLELAERFVGASA